MHMYALKKNLAMGLVTRFDHLCHTDDLNKAISLAREFGAVWEGGTNNTQANVNISLLHLDRGEC